MAKRSWKHVLHALILVIDRVLIDLPLPSIKIGRDILRNVQRFQFFHGRQHAGNLLGRHGLVFFGLALANGKNHFRAIGNAARSPHFDAAIADSRLDRDLPATRGMMAAEGW